MAAIWWLTKDGDRDRLAMYEKHYSAYKYRDGRKRSQFVGPGQTIVLRTIDAKAVFVWRKFIDTTRNSKDFYVFSADDLAALQAAAFCASGRT